MKECGKMIKNMVKDILHIRMGNLIKEISFRDCTKVKGY